MELNWNFQRVGGGGANQKTFHGGGGGYGYFLQPHNFSELHIYLSKLHALGRIVHISYQIRSVEILLVITKSERTCIITLVLLRINVCIQK